MLKSTSPTNSGCPASAAEPQAPPTFVFNLGVVNAPKPGVRVVGTVLRCGCIKVEAKSEIQKEAQVEKVDALSSRFQESVNQKTVGKPEKEILILSSLVLFFTSVLISCFYFS